MLYSAEIDGVESSEKLEKNNVNWDNVKFVELKQTKFFRRSDSGRKDKNSFNRNRTLDAWTQSYLTRIDKIVYGFRNEDGRIERIETYRIEDLMKLSKVCILFSLSLIPLSLQYYFINFYFFLSGGKRMCLLESRLLCRKT